MVFYRYCFSIETLSPTEWIVYSALISKSITSNPEYFSSDGSLCPVVLRSFLAFNSYALDLPVVNISKLAEQLEMSRNTIKRVLRKLKAELLIIGGSIKVPQRVIDEGFFNLPEGTGLSGIQLIVYGYMLNQADMFGGTVNTWASTIAEHMRTSTHNIRCIISILHKKGFTERLSNGRLKIKNVEEAISTSST